MCPMKQSGAGLSNSDQLTLATCVGFGTQWHLDEMAVVIGGKRLWLWRAVDSEGEILDMLVQPRRDKSPSAKFGFSISGLGRDGAASGGSWRGGRTRPPCERDARNRGRADDNG